MENPLVFAVICLILGCVVVVQIPIRLRAAKEGTIGCLIYALILVSLACFLLSLGGTGVALATNKGSLAHILEGVAVISGFATLGSPLLAILYGVVRFFVRRASGASS